MYTFVKLHFDRCGRAVNVLQTVVEYQNFTVEVLRESYATQHAIGVVAWLELDSKIENDEKIAVMKLKAT